MFPGIDTRLKKEITALAPIGVKAKVLASPNRKYSSWIGGSICCSLPDFQELWTTRDEYNEAGSHVIHRNYFD